jgi:DNA-binding response OmpR family regulator
MVPQQLLRPRAARILVVEDEVLTRVFIAEELRLEGFSVIEADRADVRDLSIFASAAI